MSNFVLKSYCTRVENYFSMFKGGFKYPGFCVQVMQVENDFSMFKGGFKYLDSVCNR